MGQIKIKKFVQDKCCISYTQLYNCPVPGMNRKQMDTVGCREPPLCYLHTAHGDKVDNLFAGIGTGWLIDMAMKKRRVILPRRAGRDCGQMFYETK